MSDNKKYYYLKLKDTFFDSDEIKILESLPNGVYYSNLLIKLYLKALNTEGALRFNEFIAYDANMLATITNIHVDIVKSALEVFKAMKLIEVLENGTIYITSIQSLIGRSSSEGDRKRKYREKILEEKQTLEEVNELKELKGGQLSEGCPLNVPKVLDKCPPEIERELDKELELDLDKENREKSNIIRLKTKNNRVYPIESPSKDSSLPKVSTSDNLSLDLLKKYKNIDGISIRVINKAIKKHELHNVILAIESAIDVGKPRMSYINGILTNWKREGYPKEREENINDFNRADGEKTSRIPKSREFSEEELKDIL